MARPRNPRERPQSRPETPRPAFLNSFSRWTWIDSAEVRPNVGLRLGSESQPHSLNQPFRTTRGYASITLDGNGSKTRKLGGNRRCCSDYSDVRAAQLPPGRSL